jgi:hypothetical protein
MASMIGELNASMIGELNASMIGELNGINDWTSKWHD